MASSRSDYGTITGQSTGFATKELEDQTDSLRKSIEDAVQQIRKNTEDLRSIGLRIRTRLTNKTDLHGNINTLTRSTREIVEECVSQLRTLRLRSTDVVSVSDIQQRVSGAVNDFQRLSQEVMLSLRHSGKSKGSKRRRHNYRSFNDSGSEAGLSDSMGYEQKRLSLDSSGRVSSPEQQVFIIAAPSRQVNFEDMESDLQALETIMTDMKMMSTEEPKTAHTTAQTNGSVKTPSSSQQQIQFSHTQNSIDCYQSQVSGESSNRSKKTKCCSCCCIS